MRKDFSGAGAGGVGAKSGGGRGKKGAGVRDAGARAKRGGGGKKKVDHATLSSESSGSDFFQAEEGDEVQSWYQQLVQDDAEDDAAELAKAGMFSIVAVSLLPDTIRCFFDANSPLQRSDWIAFPGDVCRTGATSFESGVEAIADLVPSASADYAPVGLGPSATYIRIEVGQWQQGREPSREDGGPDVQFDPQVRTEVLFPASLETLRPGAWVGGEDKGPRS